MDFEALLAVHRQAVERFVKFRLPSMTDAEDILQDVFVTAYHKREQLKDAAAFKPWLLSIARSKCNDYFRDRARKMEIPLDDLMVNSLSYGRFGLTPGDTVQDALLRLGNQDQQILYLFFWRQWPQKEIADRLQIPLGTVKSRLHTAKEHFKRQFAEITEREKGETNMKNLPDRMPKYTIIRTEEPPFSVRWEELQGWFLVPRLGESCTWGMYDWPERKLSHSYELKAHGRAMVHGIEGVEISAREAPDSPKDDTLERTFVAQLTDTHCRYLAALRTENGIRKYITFLDEDDFYPNWGYGENNCGNEVQLSPKGIITRKGDQVYCPDERFLLDLTDRCILTIGGKTYDTVCLMNIESLSLGVISEQYLDCHGRTVLWRRFNKDDWAFHRYQKKWTEKLPDNERLSINGETYVHWYDCISDYIL